MKVTVSRWYPVLIMRDQRGRFARVRVALAAARARRRRSSMLKQVLPVFVQLALF